MKSQSVVIEGKDLSVGYSRGKQEVVVHKGLNFQLCRGELACLLGSNGAGKSTLLRTLAAVQNPLAGEITLLGKPLRSYSPRERSRTIGIVLTDKTQAGGLSVRELVALGRQPHTGFFGRLDKEDNRLIDHAMEAVGIAEKSSAYTAELSDGERQKVMIAKALVQECPLILLDEPTAFLDVVSRIEIMTLLHRLASEEQRAILMSTHDIEQALVLGDKLWLLKKNEGLSCGVTEDMILGHHMDTLFPHEDIRFDSMHGIYSPAVKGGNSVCLTASDETLRHWTQNALNRNGYLCLAPQTSDDKNSQIPLLNVRSSNDLILTRSGCQEHYASFQDLLDAL